MRLVIHWLFRNAFSENCLPFWCRAGRLTSFNWVTQRRCMYAPLLLLSSWPELRRDLFLVCRSLIGQWQSCFSQCSNHIKNDSQWQSSQLEPFFRPWMNKWNWLHFGWPVCSTTDRTVNHAHKITCEKASRVPALVGVLNLENTRNAKFASEKILQSNELMWISAHLSWIMSVESSYFEADLLSRNHGLWTPR